MVHDHDPIGHRDRLLLVVRDEEERRPQIALEPLEKALHLTAQLGVECAERLVKQHEPGFTDNRAREGDALPLPTGQLGRVAGLEPRQRDPLQRLLCPRPHLGAAHAADREPVGDVLGDRQMREQRVVLKTVLNGHW